MPDIAKGVVKFKKQIYPEKADLYQKLALGQSPDTLFITCSDSRISPNLITQTEPGELFICRNAGNIVPPHSKFTGGMTATIEFAVAVLKVPHIVICGHMECGAMKAALNPEGIEGIPHVSEWLAYARAAAQIVHECGEGKSEEERMRMMTERNVLLQISHLETHPYVAAGLATGKVDIHGWVYDIKTGSVDAYDENLKKFVPVEERYADKLAELAKEATSCSPLVE